MLINHNLFVQLT